MSARHPDSLALMYGQGLHTVFVDANVLYSRTLRDWFFLMGMSGAGEIYRVRWSEDVLVEALYHLRREHPTWNSGQIEDVRSKLETGFADCKVTGFDVSTDAGPPDPHDLHVHSAALACGADIVLTADVPYLSWWEEKSDHLPYEAHDPDSFFCLVEDSAPDIVVDTIHKQSVYWAMHKGEARLVETLQAAGAVEFADRVARHLRRIALRG